MFTFTATNIVSIIIVAIIVLGLSVRLLSARPKLRLKHLRGALRVAKKDGKDPTEMIYYADVFVIQCGMQNLVRDDIATQKPAMSAMAEAAEKKAEEIKKETNKKISLIRTATATAVTYHQRQAADCQREGDNKTAVQQTIGNEKVHAQKILAVSARDSLAETAEIEAIITNQA